MLFKRNYEKYKQAEQKQIICDSYSQIMKRAFLNFMKSK